jgi:probable phosphoglycerate mutase
MAFSAAHHRFDALYSSDLARARQTAEALAQREGHEIRLLPDLRERCFGIFEGLTAAEGEARYPEAYRHYIARDLDYDFESGESLRAFAARIERAIAFLLRHHAGQTLAAVTHGGVLDVLYRRATDRPLETPRDFAIPNCSLNWFRFDAHGWHLESWGDRHYLQQVLTQPPE